MDMVPDYRARNGEAPGRLQVGRPIATIDIGSNSVRLVAYEGLTRAPTPLYNEKVLCGLGRNVATTGQLDREAMERALKALMRFRLLCRTMDVGELHVLATSAAAASSSSTSRGTRSAPARASGSAALPCRTSRATRRRKRAASCASSSS